MTMRKKRTISIQHPQLVRFRNALREEIFRSKLVEMGRLLNEGKGLEPTESSADMEKVKVLNDKQDKLASAWKESLCTCSLCGSRTSDMTFNTCLEGWFCVECYKEHQAFYKAKAEKGEIWTSEDGIPSTKWWP